MTFSSIEVKLTAKRINFWASVKPCDLYQYMSHNPQKAIYYFSQLLRLKMNQTQSQTSK